MSKKLLSAVKIGGFWNVTIILRSEYGLLFTHYHYHGNKRQAIKRALA